jgi:hypothetical protein
MGLRPNHRIVIGRAVRVVVVDRLLLRRLEGRVVVEQIGLVGIDVPVGRPGRLRREAGAAQSLIEIPGLSVEHVGVRKASLVVIDEVRVVVDGSRSIVGADLDGRDGIFARVRIQIADDQEVGVAARRGIGRDPVDESSGGSLAGDVAVPLSIPHIRIADVLTIGTLRLEVVDDHREARTAREILEGLGKRWSILRIQETGRRSSRASRSPIGTTRRLVDETHADRVGADDACIDPGAATAPAIVQPSDQTDRSGSTPAVFSSR